MSNTEPARDLSLLLLKTRMAYRQTILRILKRNNVDMTFEMLQVMHCLWTEQGVSQQSLAEKTSKDKACLTNLINNLEKKGWVIRKEDASDRRNRHIYLTPAGEALANQVRPLLKDFYVQTGKKMTNKRIQNCMNHLNLLNEIFDKL